MFKIGMLFAAALAVVTVTGEAVYAVDRNVTIHNETGYTIYRFRSTNSGSKKWGSDVMGTSTLPDGSAMNLNFDNKYGYCEFDFRIEFEDGTAYDEYGVNVCEVGDFTFR